MQIHVVPSFHYDVAYLKRYEEYLPECLGILDEAVELLERHADYCFTVEQVILLEEYWARHPHRRESLKRLAAEGRLAVAPGMYVMPDMNLPDGESLLMQVELGRQWLKAHLGIEPRCCWIADCWGHHGQLPQILKLAGYEGYVFWRCMRRDVLKSDFLWRGIDGTTIQTHWLSHGYAGLRFPTEAEAANALELNYVGVRPEDIEAIVQEMGKYGSHSTLLMCNGGDVTHPQGSTPGVVRRLNDLGTLPPLVLSTPDRFFDALSRESMPEVAGEFNVAFQGTFTTNIRIKQQNRHLVADLCSLETQLAAEGRAAEVESIWKLVLKQQFHDIICGTITDGAVEDAWHEQDQAATMIEAIRGAAESSEAGYFNPLPWPRKELVQRHGRPAVVEVPGLGSAGAEAARLLSAGSSASLPLEWENAFYRVRIGNKGFIESLKDRYSGRELVNAEHPAPFASLTLQMDFGDSWLNFQAPLAGGSAPAVLTQNDPDPYDRWTPEAITGVATYTPTIEAAEVVYAGEEMLVIRQKGKLRFWQSGFDFQTEATFRRWSGRIDYVTRFEPTGKNYRVRLACPTTLRGGRRYDEIAFGLQADRVGEQVVQNFVALCDEECGIALLNRGIPAANVHDGVLLSTVFRSVAMEYKTPSVLSYAQGMNHTFEYSVLPVGAKRLFEAAREAQMLNRPLVRTRAAARPAFEVESGEVICSRCQRRPDGRLLLRFYEPVGRAATLRLRVLQPCSQAHEASVFGEAGNAMQVDNGRLSIEFRPYETKTLLLG